jgi:hypothetical protein
MRFLCKATGNDGKPETITIDKRAPTPESFGCCDGFMVVPALSPQSCEDFCSLVVSELQRRGRLRRSHAAEWWVQNTVQRESRECEGVGDKPRQ